MTEREILDRDTFDFLRPRNVRTSQFYILPEIHKKGIPGRPIVTSCGAPTENISLFVDYHLHPLVKKILWTHGEDKLIKFINGINTYSTIEFTAEWSRESITFLDTKVTREENRLVTDLYTKPTDTHQYLHR